MERDFLGLAAKGSSVTVKEETCSESSRDSAPIRGLRMHWSFPYNASDSPQFLSFKPSQDSRPRKSSDRAACTGFKPAPAADAFDSSCKPYYTVVQNSTAHEWQGGNQFTYGLSDPDAYPAQRPQGFRVFPGSNQQSPAVNVSMSTPALQSILVQRGKHTIGSTTNAQPLGAIPIMAAPLSVIPAPSPVVGTTDMRHASKPSSAPAQLTIFYAGSVCVYDDVSPEKAQAIMLLAGNGSSTAHNKTVPAAPVQSPVPRSPAASGGYMRSRSPAMTPVAVPALQSLITLGGNSIGTNERTAVNAVEVLPTSCTQTEKIAVSAAPGAPNLIPSVGLPQMRKASLARFLEKRKERVMSTSPYATRKGPADCLSSSVNSGTSPLQPIDLQ